MEFGVCGTLEIITNLFILLVGQHFYISQEYYVFKDYEIQKEGVLI